MPLGKTTFAWTVPLASMVPFDVGLILMSLMVTFCRISGLGLGAGKIVGKVRSGIMGVEIRI